MRRREQAGDHRVTAARTNAVAYRLVPYDPAFKEQIAELQRHLWHGGRALNTAYFEWKYEQNPYLGDPLVYLALDGRRVVGMRGMFGSRWEAGRPAESFLVPAADDLVIDPDHRGRGLFAQIMQAAFADLSRLGFQYAVSLSPGPATLASSLASGWQSLGPMHVVRREVPPGPAGRRLRAELARHRLLRRGVRRVARVAGTDRRMFARLDARQRSGARAGWPGVSVSLTPRVEAMAGLVRRLGHDGRLRHVRDQTYLDWRFRNPLHEYRFLYLDGERLEGYMVLQRYRLHAGRGVNIVDWEATELSGRADLLGAAIDWGQFSRLSTWMAAVPPDAAALLQEAGFLPGSEGLLARHLPTILVRAVDGGPASELTAAGQRLRDPRSWDLRMVYTMMG
jgi:GNAT superfamily N-acetyltransferase